MQTLLKLLGWVLLVPGGLFLLISPFALYDVGAGGFVGVLMIGGFFAAPGGLLLRAGITRQRETALQEQMVGFVRTHESFSLEELATDLGKTPAEAQVLLHRDIAKFQLPLVMHRASRRYMRIDRLARGGQVAERCQSCGGAIDRQILFEGEQLPCPYCGMLVATQAPQASWQQARGAWGQQAWAQPQAQPVPDYQPVSHYQAAQGQPQQGQPPNQQQGGPWGHGG